jgi:hypothetical protein
MSLDPIFEACFKSGYFQGALECLGDQCRMAEFEGVKFSKNQIEWIEKYAAKVVANCQENLDERKGHDP